MFAQGMVAGAVVGGAWGAISDRESVLGGAFKGAMVGGFAARHGPAMKASYMKGMGRGMGMGGSAMRAARHGALRGVQDIREATGGLGRGLFGNTTWNKMMATLRSNRGGK